MRTGSDLFAIDANVILRYLAQDDAELSAKADILIEGVEDGKLRVFCEPVTLAEVVWTMSSFYKRSRPDVWDALEPIVKLEGFVMPNKPRYIKALELLAESIPHFGDACACAAAMDECEGRLLSFDRKLSGVEGIVRIERPEV